ncbi:MAG: hypothetical protein NVS4B12_19240 [Ktedonobacteraceae bacterium]
MTRITSYNILAGGYDVLRNGITHRTRQLTTIIRSTQPDIVGLAEAINPLVVRKPLIVEQIADELGMQLIKGSEPTHYQDYQTALLTKLPVVYTKLHSRPGILTRPLLEVCVEEVNGEHLIVFITHLSAAFSHGWAGNAIRMREVREILHILAQVQDKPHVIMGDFNSMAPGDPFKASFLLRYIVQMDQKQRTIGTAVGNPHLNFVVPAPLRFLNPLLRIIPKSALLSNLFDLAASLYAPRSTIALLQDAGYIDSYRRIHPHAFGFTCPSTAPAGRIDYIFANSMLSERLETCYTVVDGDGLPGKHASDHLAVSATFCPLTQKTTPHGVDIVHAISTP